MSLAKANKVAVFFHRLGPYHFARLRAAGQLMAATAIEASNVDEVYCWDQVAGEDGFKRITLCTGEAVRTLPSAELAQRVYSALDQLKPEVVVIAGWAQKEGLAGMQWCMSRQIPVVIMSDSTEWDYFRVPWKEWVKRRILGLCSAAFVAGAPHLDYLVGLGMDRERIFLGFDTVDNSYFKVKSAEAKGQREHYAAEAGLPDRYFLTTARFVQKKNLGRLIDAFGKYRQLARERNPGDLLWSLVLVGDGPLRPELTRQIASLGLQDSVHLTGFRQYEELPAYYGLASAFILASTTDQWGLVVNEAMASGLPVLVSNRCGCARDLVREGVNGFTFDPRNTEQMAEAMFRLADKQSSADGLSKMGEASLEIVSGWGADRFAHGLLAAVQTALKSPCPKMGPLDATVLKGLIYL